MISGINDLSTHLLGNHQHKEDDENGLNCDEEEGCMPYDEEYEESQSSSDKNEQSYLLLFVLHFLLFETFGMALYASPVWVLMVNCSIVLFVIVASIYTQAMKDWKPSCSAIVFFLPEILQIIILSVMIFSNVGALCLLLVIINRIRPR
jgi:hypothetical protein